MQKYLLHEIAHILHAARQRAGRAVNAAMVEAYWWASGLRRKNCKGRTAQEYGLNLLGHLSAHLPQQFGAGFDPSNLSNMREFYRAFPMLNALRQELTWTHSRSLLRMESYFSTQSHLLYPQPCNSKNATNGCTFAHNQ